MVGLFSFIDKLEKSIIGTGSVNFQNRRIIYATVFHSC